MNRFLLIICLALALCITPQSKTASAQEAEYQGSRSAYLQFTFAYEVLKRARTSLDEKDRKLAAEAFDDFLFNFPDEPLFGDAIYYRALIAHLEGKNNEAHAYLARGKRPSMVSDQYVHLLRGQVAAGLRLFDDALGHFAKIDTGRVGPDMLATVLLARAGCYQHQGKTKAAATTLKRVIAVKSPVQARALLTLAQLEVQLGQTNEAIDHLQLCLALKDRSTAPEAAWMAGDLQFKNGQLKSAIAHFQTVVQHYSDSPRFARCVTDLMWAHYEADDHETVTQTFEKYRELLPKQRRVEAFNLAATAHQRTGDHHTASALLTAYLNRVQGSPIEDQVRYKLALSQFELGLYRAMSDTIDRLKAAHADSPFVQDAEFLLARAAMRQDKPNQAEARLAAIIAAGRNHRYYTQALYQRAWLYESRDRLEPAIRDYELMLEQRLTTDDAQRHDIALRLVHMHTRLQQFRAAADRANDLLGLHGGDDRPRLDPFIDQEALYRLGWALIKLKDYEPAHEALAALNERHPLNQYRVDALYLDGVVLMSLERHEESVAAMQKALAEDSLDKPKRLNALRLCSLHYRKTRQDDAAGSALLELAVLSKDEALRRDERLWLGRHLHAQSKYQPAAGFLQPLLGRNPNIPVAMRTEAVFLTARCQRALGRRLDAIQLYRQVIALDAGFVLEAWLEMANTKKDEGLYEEALIDYEGLMNERQTMIAASAMLNCAQTHRAIARQHAFKGDGRSAETARDAARKMLLRLLILHGSTKISPLPELARVELAEVETAFGRTLEAESEYKKIVDEYAGSAYAAYAQAMLHVAARQRESALQKLRVLEAADIHVELAQRVKMRIEKLEAVP